MRMTSIFQRLTVLIGLLAATASSGADERLNLLKNVSRAGAPALTLKMLDQAQPGVRGIGSCA